MSCVFLQFTRRSHLDRSEVITQSILSHIEQYEKIYLQSTSKWITWHSRQKIIRAVFFRYKSGLRGIQWSILSTDVLVTLGEDVLVLDACCVLWHKCGCAQLARRPLSNRVKHHARLHTRTFAMFCQINGPIQEQRRKVFVYYGSKNIAK